MASNISSTEAVEGQGRKSPTESLHEYEKNNKLILSVPSPKRIMDKLM